MEAGDNRAIATILKSYKLKTGEINYPAIFSIPSTERLPALYKQDFMKATALVVAAISLAFEKMNLKRKKDLNVGVLVNNIAEEVIDTCEEDNIGLEDLVLFLQGLVRGKYGNVEELSVAKFMNLFDQYRDERHFAMQEIKMNEHLQYKALGDSNRSYKQDPLSEHFSSLGQTISELKSKLEYKNNPKLKDIDKF